MWSSGLAWMMSAETVRVQQCWLVRASADADPLGVELGGRRAVGSDMEVRQIACVRAVWIAQAMFDALRIDVALRGFEVWRAAARAVQMDAMGTGRQAGHLDQHEHAVRGLLDAR